MASGGDNRPNIVLIMADDMGFSDPGCYGGEIHTPNLDRLADDGVRFTHFYNNAVCVATRASLLTGLYSHQVGENWGANLQKGKNNITIAELLKKAGYRTLMSGKWHNGDTTGTLPVDRGFDRYWGLLSGCGNYFNPGEKRSGEAEPVHKSPGNLRPWGDDDKVMFPYTPEDPNFYATDAFTRHALEFLDIYGGEDRPFLMYLAHAAPHFPMQAWETDIARYQGKYMGGWDELRRQRHGRMVRMGLVNSSWSISDRDEMVPEWSGIEERESWDRKMAVYAAMIDRMDRGIGMVLEKIKALGKEDNTLVLFLSDNGGCGEHIDNTPERPPGPVDTYKTVDANWAIASNTPFRKFKVFDHEGGISTPLIARWPGVIEKGRITHGVGHVIDLLPTFAELAEADYPENHNSHRILPCEGRSLVPVLNGGEMENHAALFWEFKGCRAARKGKWKIVSEGAARRHVGHAIEPGHEGWELYDMEADRCELNDLAGSYPDIVHELDGLWQDWRTRCRNDQENQ